MLSVPRSRDRPGVAVPELLVVGDMTHLSCRGPQAGDPVVAPTLARRIGKFKQMFERLWTVSDPDAINTTERVFERIEEAVMSALTMGSPGMADWQTGMRDWSAGPSWRTLGERPARVAMMRRRRVVLLLLVAMAAVVAGLLLVPHMATAVGDIAPARAATGDGATVLPATALRERTVAPGDTLWSIASQIAGDSDPRPVVDRIAELNGLASQHLVPGQILVVPTRL